MYQMLTTHKSYRKSNGFLNISHLLTNLSKRLLVVTLFLYITI